MRQSEKDPNVWSTVPHGGTVVLTEEDLRPLQAPQFVPYSQVVTDAQMPEFVVSATETTNVQIVLPVVASDDVRFEVYTTPEVQACIAEWDKERRLRKAQAKRKKRARARTGRRE